MRKLAAIMFTDIEGFTKMMQHNEAEALALLERHKQMYVQCTRLYKGQIIKYMGDGTLTIFSSAIEAVHCAIAFQKMLQKEPPVPVRIGIHQGDVLIEKKDVIGDAVNLACRIQTHGIAGSVLISEKVHDELHNHDEIKTVSIGSADLKNVSHPVKLYAIASPGLKVPPVSSSKKDLKTLEEPRKKTAARFFNNPRVLRTALLLVVVIVVPVFVLKYSSGTHSTDGEKTIAVLPFENMDKSEKNNFLADGLTEEMISLLSSNVELKVKKLPLSVINNPKVNLSRLLKEIHAGSVLEGKVQHDKDSLLIFVSLRNTATNEVIWSKKYNRQFRDLMNVQEQVALQIADALNTNFTQTDLKSFVLDRTYNSEAYNLYIQGRYAQKKRTSSSMQEAIFFFNKALAEDPDFALAYSGIGDTYTILVDNGYISYDSGFNLARNAVNHAFVLDSTSAEIRASKAIFLSTLEGRRADALNELKLSLNKSPNYAAAHQWYALELAADGQFDSAISHINNALELEPFSERIWLNKALILEFARKYQEAVNVLNYSMVHFPDNNELFRDLKADCHYWLGQKDSVLYYAATGQGALNDFKFWEPVCTHNKKKLEKHLKDQLVKDSLDNETLATYYVFLDKKDKAMDYIEKAYAAKEFSWLKYINVAPAWYPLRDEPRFKNMLVMLGFN